LPQLVLQISPKQLDLVEVRDIPVLAFGHSIKEAHTTAECELGAYLRARKEIGAFKINDPNGSLYRSILHEGFQ
jgi:hypothetical protein